MNNGELVRDFWRIALTKLRAQSVKGANKSSSSTTTNSFDSPAHFHHPQPPRPPAILLLQPHPHLLAQLYPLLSFADLYSLRHSHPLFARAYLIHHDLHPFRIPHLPPEILHEIFLYLDQTTFYAASCVCARWREVAQSSRRLLTSNLEDGPGSGSREQMDLPRMWRFITAQIPRGLCREIRTHQVFSLDFTPGFVQQQKQKHANRIYLSNRGGVIGCSGRHGISLHAVGDLFAGTGKRYPPSYLGRIAHMPGEVVKDVCISNVSGTPNHFHIAVLYNGGTIRKWSTHLRRQTTWIADPTNPASRTIASRWTCQLKLVETYRGAKLHIYKPEDDSEATSVSLFVPPENHSRLLACGNADGVDISRVAGLDKLDDPPRRASLRATLSLKTQRLLQHARFDMVQHFRYSPLPLYSYPRVTPYASVLSYHPKLNSVMDVRQEGIGRRLDASLRHILDLRDDKDERTHTETVCLYLEWYYQLYSKIYAPVMRSYKRDGTFFFIQRAGRGVLLLGANVREVGDVHTSPPLRYKIRLLVPPNCSAHLVSNDHPAPPTAAIQISDRSTLVAIYWDALSEIWLYDMPDVYRVGCVDSECQSRGHSRCQEGNHRWSHNPPRSVPIYGHRLVKFKGGNGIGKVTEMRFWGGTSSSRLGEEPPCAGKAVLAVVMKSGYVHLCQFSVGLEGSDWRKDGKASAKWKVDPRTGFFMSEVEERL